MDISILDIVRSINEAISDQVLPEIEAQSWPASRLRSCNVLLTYLEDLLSYEQSVLRDSNQNMKVFLRELFERARHGGGDIALQKDGEDCLRRFSQYTLTEDIKLLRKENRAYKEFLLKIVRSRYGVDKDNLAALHKCLRAVREAESRVAERASKLLPL